MRALYLSRMLNGNDAKMPDPCDVKPLLAERRPFDATA